MFYKQWFYSIKILITNPILCRNHLVINILMYIYINVNAYEIKENLDQMIEQTVLSNLTTTEMPLESFQISIHKSNF